MDAQTLREALGFVPTLERCALFVPGYNAAMLRCGMTTVNRAAMFVAQTGEESAHLAATEEYASGAEYEGRADLGNTQPGDGVRYKGRGIIMATGRHNYTALSLWAFRKGLVPSQTFFVDHPERLADFEYAFTGAEWYWTVARPQLNALADAGDIEGATRAVNGGLNGLATRTTIWNAARALGDRILPTHPAAPTEVDVALIIRSDRRPEPWPLVDTGSKVIVSTKKSTRDALAAAGAKPVTVAHVDYLRFRKGAVK